MTSLEIYNLISARAICARHTLDSLNPGDSGWAHYSAIATELEILLDIIESRENAIALGL